MKSYFISYFFAVVIIIGAANDAHAYVDPGAGSFLLQNIMIWAVGAFAAVKSAFSLRNWFKNKLSRDNTN